MKQRFRGHAVTSMLGWVVAAGAIGCGGPEVRALAITEKNGSLSLVVGTFDRTCEEADSIILQCGRWELLVNLDPEAQTGEQPLASEYTWAESFLSDGDPDGNECLVQGGTFEQGTVEITDRTGERVSYTITGTAVGNFDADGSYDATFCP